MLLKKQKFAIILSLFLLLATPFFASAGGLVPCGGPETTATDTGKPCTLVDIFSMVAIVTNWLISVAGLYAVFQIVNAGFWLVTSMGNEENITKWKTALSNAVVGFVLVMIAYILINTAVNGILLESLPAGSPFLLDLKHPFTYLKKQPSN